MTHDRPPGYFSTIGQWRWGRIAVAAILACGIAVLIARAHETELIATQFEVDAHQVLGAARHRIESNLALLRTFSAFYSSSRDVDRGEFAQFAQIQLEMHPDLRSVAWIPRVPSADRGRHEQAMRDGGAAGYALFQKDAAGQHVPAEPRDTHYPLAYIEPGAEFAACVGLDLASKPERVAAFERAIDRGTPAITHRVDASADDPSHGEIVAGVLPVTYVGRPMATPRERAEYACGFVQVDFCPIDLVARRDPTAPTTAQLRLQFFDESSGAPRTLVDQAQGNDIVHTMAHDASLGTEGRTWRLRVVPTTAYVLDRRSLRPWIWGVVAALLAILVGALIEAVVSQAHVVETQVAERTADLAQSEARYRALFDNASDLIVSVSTEGRIELANRAWADRLGDPTTVGRGDLHDLVVPERRDALEAQVGSLLMQHDTTEISMVLMDREGNPVELEGHARVRRHSGRPIAIQAILRNVTERRRLEEVLAQREKSLVESNKMQAVSQLAGGLAHEFNNLLTTISGFAQFLAESLAGSPDMKQDVDEILIAAERGSQLTRQLLMFTHQQPSKPEPLDLNARLTLLLPTLRLLTGRGIQLSLDVDPSEPRVEIDHAQFEQVLINLVSNARDAMPGGGTIGISTRVEVHQQRFSAATGVLDPGRYAVIRVRDTGEGLGPEVRRRLFEPFFTTRTQRHAAGLGLSIAYSVISQAGGAITVESELGKGTCVALYLPRSNSAKTDKIARMTTISGARILLAEDEAQVRQMTARMLRQASFEVIEAADGVEALTVLERRSAELGLLVTDVIMPNMGGAELARRAKAIDPDLPVIFVSGYTAQALSEHGALMPGCELVHKPFVADVFVEKVREQTRAVGRKHPPPTDQTAGAQ